ncbi:MAG: aldehyde dehydrogenase [Hadesarchaea archaeon]|nr:MAG: aldehyde dehydrogenase [Hadesarchaea archaeon]HDI13125.1 aldehyde dehydrogenase family protein [Hadesarchaea archaeon]
MSQNFRNFIDGKWMDSTSGETFDNVNPANKDEILSTFPRSGPQDVDLAVQAARKALKGWSKVTPPSRGRILFEAGRIMSEKKTELARTLVKEVGKTMNEALGEVKAAVDMCYFMAGEGRRLYGETTYSELPNRLAMTKRYPVGVCGIITPWNFPLSLISWKVCPALICGNTVVLKPAEDTPETANNFVEIMSEAGLPGGVLNLVHGLGEEAGEALVRHENIDLISFTGSSEVGRKIATLCGERLTKVSLELGGKNASIVMEDCDLELAVDSIVRGAFTVAGQRCTATSRAIVHAAIYDEFIEKLVEKTKKLRVGPGDDESTDVCPMINEKQLNRVMKYVEIGKKEGAKLLLGGSRLTTGVYSKGFYFEPTIFTEVRPDMVIAREEIFGPVLVVLKVNSLEEAIKVHNSTEYGLSASIFTKDVARAMGAIDRMEAGVCYVNAPTFGSEVHLPFGGVKMSGNGHREVGKAALDVFSEWKTIYVDYSGGVQNVQFQKD